jgi:predicted transcriptional regulator
MMALTDGEQWTSYQLAKSLSISPGSVSGQLIPLQNYGMVTLEKQTKEDDPEDYRYLINPTEIGIKVGNYIIDYCRDMMDNKYMFKDFTWNMAKVKRDHGTVLEGLRDVIKEGLPDDI